MKQVTAEQRAILAMFWDKPTDLEFLARQEEVEAAQAEGQVEMTVKMTCDAASMPLELPPPQSRILKGGAGEPFVRFVAYGK
jgi:hypothetical protein